MLLKVLRPRPCKVRQDRLFKSKTSNAISISLLTVRVGSIDHKISKLLEYD